MHPCCEGSLQTGTKIIAITQMVFSIMILCYGIYVMNIGNEAADELDQVLKHNPQLKDAIYRDKADTVDSVAYAAYVLIVIGVVGTLLALVLLLGAIKRNRGLCMVWFVVTVIGAVLALLNFLESVDTAPAYSNYQRFFGIVLNGYFLWVVGAFMKEIKEGSSSGTMQYGNLLKV